MGLGIDAQQSVSSGADRAGSAGAGGLRFRLRDATAADHEAVDRAYSGFDFTAPDGYPDFLLAQYSCLAPLEAALTDAGAGQLMPQWPLRRRAALLAADLLDLGIVCEPHTDAESASFGAIFDGMPAVLGALYVLEGSRFGGAVLARQLAPGVPARFLGAPVDAQVWRGLIAEMERHLDTEPAFAEALRAARGAFAAFEAAARARLEPGGV